MEKWSSVFFVELVEKTDKWNPKLHQIYSAMHFLRKRPQSTLNFGELGLFSQQLHNLGIVSREKIVFGVFLAISLTIQLCLGAQNLKVVNRNIYKLIRRRPKPTLLTSPSWFTTLANNIIYEIRAHCLPHQSEKIEGPFL